MPSFVGTNKAFKRYVGPRLRNVVNSITKEYRVCVGVCQHCGATEGLESAHIHGRERTTIIDAILEEFTNGEIVTIDLSVFEEKFKRSHDPIQDTIKILCKDCHRAYDSNTQQTASPNVTPVVSQSDTDDVDEIQEITNSQITNCIREIVSTTLPIEEVNNLTVFDYCSQTFGLHYEVLKPIPNNANNDQIQRLAKDRNGYNRWSIRSPIERDGVQYLVTTQWYDRNRLPFIKWMREFQ